MIQTMKKLKSGYINGTRVMLGNLGDFLNTSAITDLSFLGSQEDGYPDRKLNIIIKYSLKFFFFKTTLGLNPSVQTYLDEHLLRAFSQRSTVNVKSATSKPRRELRRRMSCKGAIKKTRSINVDSMLYSNYVIFVLFNREFFLQVKLLVWKQLWQNVVNRPQYHHHGLKLNNNHIQMYLLVVIHQLVRYHPYNMMEVVVIHH